MSERDKVTVDDIIGLIKTDEPINSVEEVKKLRGRENDKFTVVELTEVLLRLVQKGFGDKYVRVSVTYDDVEHIQDFEKIDVYDCFDWVQLRGGKY